MWHKQPRSHFFNTKNNVYSSIFCPYKLISQRYQSIASPQLPSHEKQLYIKGNHYKKTKAFGQGSSSHILISPSFCSFLELWNAATHIWLFSGDPSLPPALWGSCHPGVTASHPPAPQAPRKQRDGWMLELCHHLFNPLFPPQEKGQGQALLLADPWSTQP